MKHSDVQRTIENLENALRVHPDKGYEIGSLEEAQKFAEKRNNPYKPEHWSNICMKVSDIANKVLPYLNRKKIKSEVISNLFESVSADYFNSIGIENQLAQSDRDPDLQFISGPCEIKVTGVDDITVKSCKWMGGKYSKRTSEYIFVMWNYQEPRQTLYGITEGSLYFSVYNCHVNESDWHTIDNGNENYYATVFDSSSLLSRQNTCLVGSRSGENFLLEKFRGTFGSPRK